MAEQGDVDFGLGDCRWLDCARHAAVKLNGVGMCLEHFTRGLSEAVARLKGGLRLLTDERRDG